MMELLHRHRPAENLIDKDLRLILKESGLASGPDATVPVYKFKMAHIHSGVTMGEINLRAGYTENIELYRGNIGFTVYEGFRGDHLSGRSCLLLKPFIGSLGLETIWLTCNADNVASERNLVYIGAQYVDTTHVRDDSHYAAYYPVHARVKLRYRWDIGA
jgi:predicted acetyltransferase